MPSNHSRTSPALSRAARVSPHAPSAASATPSGANSTSDVSLKRIAETYQRCCECQPLPLFDCSSGDEFVEGFSQRDDELICAVIAVTSRFLEEGSQICDVEDATQKSFRLAMQRVVNGRVELSTLQTFCILALLDFDGKT